MNLLRRIWNWLRSLGQQQALKREIDEELRFHIEQRTAENVAAGMASEDAAREARKRFGNFQSVREECREVRGASFGETTLQDVRFGVRMLRKSPGFALTMLCTIGLAIGATTVIYSFVHGIILRSLPYDSPDRIVRLNSHPRNQPAGHGNISLTDFTDWKAQSRAFQAMGYYQQQSYNLSVNGEPRRVRATRVSADFFAVFQAIPILGRTFLPEEDAPGNDEVVIVSHNFWKNHLNGAADVIGKQLSLEGRSVQIAGVMPAHFAFPEPTDLWVPAAEAANWFTSRRVDFFHAGIARLAPGVTLEQAQSEMDVIAGRLEKQFPDMPNRCVAVTRLHDALVGNIRPALRILFAAVAAVLLIACANLANLLLARAVTREREMAIRAAVGASRVRIVRQLLTESILISLFGGALGVALGYWGLRAVRLLAPAEIPRLAEVRLDLPVLGFAIVASVVTGLLFGLMPALQSGSPDLNRALKSKTASGRRRHFARNALVVTEVALSVLLLVGAALLIQSLVRLQRIQPGFETDQVLCMDIRIPVPPYRSTARRLEFQSKLADRLTAVAPHLPVSFIRIPPFNPWVGYAWLTIEGRPPVPPGETSAIAINYVSGNYFQMLGIPLLRGRTFNEQDDLEKPRAIVVSETFVRQWFADEDPIGKRLTLETATNIYEIVGIAPDTRKVSLAERPQPQIYGHIFQAPHWQLTVIIRTPESPALVAASVREAVQQTDPDVALGEVMALTKMIDQSVAEPRFRTVLLSGLAVLALVLAIVGIYGVLSYTVKQRTNEIGIRMALGAQRQDVLRLVLRHGMKLAFIGVACGVVAAFALTRVMAGLLFEVKPADPLTFVGVSILLLLIALLACWLPARRAMRVNPMVALRYE